MARTLLSDGPPGEASARILCEPVRHSGAEWRLLSHAHAEAVRRWRDETGRHFVFAWKASKFITHWKRLTENSINSLQLLDDRLSILGDKVGPILFQLPPDFAADAGRLSSFLTLLPEHRRYSFEFRHPSWYAPKILRMLADRNIALCISDHHDAPAPWERTADFVYLRGHGPGGRYEGRYSRATLAAWRKSIQDVAAQPLRRLCLLRQ